MPHVMTVQGPVDPSTLGFILPHEHTQCTLWQIQDRWDYWELTPDEPVILQELAYFKEAGGTALADLTLPGIGRNPAWLLRISELSRLPIVMGGGWYRTAYYPPEALIEKRSVDSLAEELVHDATVGVGDTGIRIGILGEIGTDKPWVTPAEERVFRAVARCSRRTGLAISTHAVLSDVGAAQLTILEEEGVDPGRVVVGHADSYPVLDHYLSLIHRGASVEFDFLGMSFTPMEKYGEAKVIDLLLELLHRGHADRVLLSHDVCHNSQLRHFEGNGYTYLSTTFLPRLRERGVSDEEIDQLTVTNPRRILTIG
jgi:predicted metal-dependent phosphotriesterase family hydrolase